MLGTAHSPISCTVSDCPAPSSSARQLRRRRPALCHCAIAAARARCVMGQTPSAVGGSRDSVPRERRKTWIFRSARASSPESHCDSIAPRPRYGSPGRPRNAPLTPSDSAAASTARNDPRVHGGATDVAGPAGEWTRHAGRRQSPAGITTTAYTSSWTGRLERASRSYVLRPAPLRPGSRSGSAGTRDRLGGGTPGGTFASDRLPYA